MPETERPLKLALAGVSHDHISILSNLSSNDFTLVGVFEANRQVLDSFGDHAGIPADRRFTNLAAMLTAVRPDGVAAFGSIRDHLAVVEACAPRSIHVMVEKPLAMSLDHALRIAELSGESGIHIVTNYETTWYASTAHMFSMLDGGTLGDIRKVLVRDGHGGPIETGCQPQFLAWLTDPSQSGGGALNDFGCYGANLLTRLAGGRLPEKVTARVRTFKPGLYPLVEDDADIIVEYDGLEGVIQASWNWPFSRKDIEVYGTTGYLLAPDALTLVGRNGGDAHAQSIAPAPLHRSRAEPFAHFAAVIRGSLVLKPDDLPSLTNNLAVVRILDAARRSAMTGETVRLA